MTKQEFIDSISNLNDIEEFCADNGFEWLFYNKYYKECDFEDVIWERVNDMYNNGSSFENIAGMLNNLPCDGYDYYYQLYDNEWCGCCYDDNYETEVMVEYVVDYMERENLFDQEEDQESGEECDSEHYTSSHRKTLREDLKAKEERLATAGQDLLVFMNANY